MKSLFVSIASYRDPELVPTLQSLVRNCSDKTRLRLVIANQGDDGDFGPVEAFRKTARVDLRHLQVDAFEAQGVSWARALTQAHFDGEDYFLMLDSHMQFAPDWDLLARSDHNTVLSRTERAVITGYLPAYELKFGQREVTTPTATNFRVHTERGLPSATAFHIPQGHLPQPSQFFSAHFAFTTGDFVERVPCDPEVFFFGDEMSLAVRAAAAGYALHVPSRYLGAHLYRNENNERRLFWQEEEEKRRKLKWWQRDVMSKHKIAAICRGEWFGLYGIEDLDLYKTYAASLKNLHGVDLSLIRV